MLDFVDWLSLQNRQDLCSALPYYRAYQSGAYTSKNIAYGILIDKDSGARSHMDEEVIITRAYDPHVGILVHCWHVSRGGHCKQAATGGLIQVSDQSSDSANVSSFLNNKRLQVPVGVIVGRSSV